MNNKNTSLFLVTVLVAGIIGMSPLSVYAQNIASQSADNDVVDFIVGENNGFVCNNINNVQNINILDVDNTNTNTNTAAAAAAANPNEPLQQQDKNNKLTPDNILDALFGNNGNGGPPLNFDDRFGCVTINNNEVNQSVRNTQVNVNDQDQL